MDEKKIIVAEWRLNNQRYPTMDEMVLDIVESTHEKHGVNSRLYFHYFYELALEGYDIIVLNRAQ